MTVVNLASNLVQTARARADSVAIRVGAADTTYGELDRESSRVAGMLAERGIQPGDPIGLMLPNVAEFASIYYGVLRAGGVVVPMNPLLKAREVAYYLGDSGARFIFAWHGFAAEARSGAERADSEGIVVDPATFAELRVSVFEGVPTMYVALLGHPERAACDVSALRVCVSGGAALPVEVLRGFEEAFGCQVLEGYGLSETSPVASFNHPDRERKPGSIGTPIRGVEMRVIDSEGGEVPQGEVGEIVIRGHNVMRGYWRRPEETAKAIPDGWFRTGDLGRVDNDGYFEIVDRKKDMIIRGGYNVYPREIEEVLYEHPAVTEAAVIGLPHQALGEEVGAAVVIKAGADITATELRDHVKAQVAAYKYPRAVWLVDALPKGPTGKILKREIVPPADLDLR